MPGPVTIVLTLEIVDHDGERIAGTLSTTAGPALPFTGWLGLAAAIERATAARDAER